MRLPKTTFVALFVFVSSCGRSTSDVLLPPPGPLGKGEIGDFVWHDLDRDGIQDIGEPGIADVTVRLRDAGGAELSQVTNAEGVYRFTALPANTYTLEVDASTLPPGFVAAPTDAGEDDAIDSDGSPVQVTLAVDEKIDTVDFGFHPEASGEVGDRVWHDVNGNGLQDPGEPGIDGVVLVLRDSAGVVLERVTTHMSPMERNGHYSFSSLAAGDYTVEVDTSTLPPRFVPSPCEVGTDRAIDSNCSPAKVALATNDTVDPTIDFGFFAPTCTGVIGDFVWADANGNGCQDPGERGIPGIVVHLLQGGRKIRETTTNSEGLYEFAGLCAGTYTIEIDAESLPPCVKPSPSEACNDVTLDSNRLPATVVLPRDDSVDRTFDFGYRTDDKGVIAGRVWEDIDNDGLQDPGEPDIGGVRVLLRDDTNKVICIEWTKSSGYRFSGLCAGVYVVEVDDKTLHPDYKLSPCRVGNDPKIDNDCSPVQVRLAANQVEDHIDIGYHRSSTRGCIGDFVWNDLDRDGIQDPGEPGFKGVRIILMDAKRTVLRTQDTDQFGAYTFDGLESGTYILEVDPRTCPPGFRMSPCRVGNDRSIDSDCSPVTVVLPRGKKDFTIDFGFYSACSFSIGDFVWHDLDGDGIQEAGEPGIESVRLILKNKHGTVLAKEFSDQDGKYRFERMCAGVYIVEVDPKSLPKGMVPSKCRPGGDPGKDNNCSPSRVWISTRSDHTIDFGYKRASPPKDHQGCSSAFWKTPGNLKLWPKSPQTKFGSVFADAFPGKTLLDVLSLDGGDLNGLGRDTVAAYLNSESSSVRYSIPTSTIKALFDHIHKRSKAERYALKKYFELLNSKGCPLR